MSKVLASSSKGVFGASGPRHRFKLKGLAFQNRWLEVSVTSVGELVKGNATAFDERVSLQVFVGARFSSLRLAILKRLTAGAGFALRFS